uniref:DUF3592 domain-containing protein n=1 Tax=uncultured Armatimonadetes bacterium TaxID=157466 RepID=A0A6J4I996_9BACT|nr:hypothetical protein AVDCRST_MAG63-1676 [uncultured Armatimonadetes bacterium]
MTLKRFVGYVICVIVAVVLLSFVLPAVGIPRSQILPPPMVYNTATGRAPGVISALRDKPSGNPFRVGERIYFFEYRFQARAPQSLGVAKPGTAQNYSGTARVTSSVYGAIKVGQPVNVVYDVTYPYINGIPGVGRSVGEGSNILSGWLLWAGAALVLGLGLFSLTGSLWGQTQT